MKNLFTLILFFAACTLVAQETDSAGNHYQDPYNPAFKKGEVLINFKEETKIVTLKSASGIVRTGIVVLDNILQKYQAKEMLKVVPNAQPLKSAQFITIAGERKKVPSLHNLYRIKVREGSDIREVVEELKKAGEVEFAEPNYLFYT
ncbi:MAG TPA: subtilase family N-terminal domain-containing protein, partial [Prolixibacteraceae bacterium]|nr:subtilase family N-terminal domain-containing protein [Prolixibacteraceae bacterium]